MTSADAPQPGYRGLVAVVDDDRAVRDSLRFLLEVSGFDVVTFASACEFFRAVQPERQACLLVDQHMPGITGLELLRRLKRDGRVLPTALMTGSPSQELVRQALELGALEVLEKPLSDEVLVRFVARVAT
jgi:FixJ family two-component response regulator